MIIIQHYREFHYKQQRHADSAKYRNQFPLVAKLPQISDVPAMLVHKRGHHYIGERFTANCRQDWVDLVETDDQANRYEDFLFKVREGLLHASFKYDYYQYGGPDRKAFTTFSPLFKLSPGETLQFRINGRRGDHDGRWVYLRHVINFAYGEFDPFMFEKNSFKRIVDLELSLV